jgi:hypothetical protein
MPSDASLTEELKLLNGAGSTAAQPARRKRMMQLVKQ